MTLTLNKLIVKQTALLYLALSCAAFFIFQLYSWSLLGYWLHLSIGSLFQLFLGKLVTVFLCGLMWPLLGLCCAFNNAVIASSQPVAVLRFAFGGQWGGHNFSWGGHGPILPQWTTPNSVAMLYHKFHRWNRDGRIFTRGPAPRSNRPCSQHVFNLQVGLFLLIWCRTGFSSAFHFHFLYGPTTVHCCFCSCLSTIFLKHFWCVLV